MKRLVGLALVALSCGQPPPPDRGPGIHDGQGTVVAIGTDHVTLNHGDIPGFMTAMTMEFPVKDSSILSGLEPGMRVTFQVQVEGSSYAVVAIEPLTSP
jgi:Cu/Ag efflux protein CusF